MTDDDFLSVALVAAAVAAIVIATASGSTTRSYTTALISKIGAGSDAVDQIIPVWSSEDTIDGISHARLTACLFQFAPERLTPYAACTVVKPTYFN